MSKTKFFGMSAAVLLLINLFLICSIFWGRPHRPRGEGPKNIIIQKLNFDETQVKEYEKLIGWHRTEIKKSEEEIKNLKNQLYSTLTKDSETTIKDSLIKEINNVQLKIENIHYKHFEDIKKLCRPDQQQAYENFTHEVASLFSHEPPKDNK